jgi:hypothetical protein
MSSHNPYESPGYAPAPKPQRGGHLPTSGMGIASLVLGILSIPPGAFGMCCCLGSPVALTLGAIGLVLGYFGMRETQAGSKAGHGLALAGTICSGIGALVGLISLLILAARIAFSAATHRPPEFNFNP